MPGRGKKKSSFSSEHPRLAILKKGAIMNINVHDLDWKSVLVKKYKEYGLNETECMVVFLSDAILSIDKKTLLTPEILIPYMSAKRDDIDASLTDLINKGVLEVKNEGGEFYSSLEGFKDRLFEDVVKDLSLKRENREISSSANFYTEIEELTSSVLSPFDKDRITTWLKGGASEGMIKEAIEKSMTASGNINFNKADKIILQMERGKSREEMGSSTVNEDTNTNEQIRDFLSAHDWTYHGDK